MKAFPGTRADAPVRPAASDNLWQVGTITQLRRGVAEPRSVVCPPHGGYEQGCSRMAHRQPPSGAGWALQVMQARHIFERQRQITKRNQSLSHRRP
jgi:hypothetical protein